MIPRKQILGRKKPEPKLWPINTYKYYVIKFLEKPFEDIDDYVCIPWTWIRLCRKKDQKVIVSYPGKNIFGTNPDNIILWNERREDDWKGYVAEVIRGTASYDDAQSYIKEKFINKHNGSKTPNTNKKRENKDHDKVKSKTEKTKRHTKPNSEENVSTESSKNGRKEPITLKIKRTVSDSDKGPAKKRSKVTFVSEVHKQSSQAFKSSGENQISPPRTLDIPTAYKSSENRTDQLNSEVLLFVQDMYTSLYGLCKRLEEIMQAANDYGSSGETLTTSLSRSITEGVTMSEENTDEEDEQNDDKDDHYYKSDHCTDTEDEVSVKKCSRAHKKKVIHQSFSRRTEKIKPAVNNPCEPSGKAPSSPIADVTDVSEGESDYERDEDYAPVEEDNATEVEEDDADEEEESDVAEEEEDNADEEEASDVDEEEEDDAALAEEDEEEEGEEGETTEVEEDYLTSLKEDEEEEGEAVEVEEDDADTAEKDIAAEEEENDIAEIEDDAAEEEQGDTAEIEGNVAEVENDAADIEEDEADEEEKGYAAGVENDDIDIDGRDDDTNEYYDGSDDNDTVQDKNNEGQVKKRQMRKFNLPPEYDENDPKWTLKHREPAPDLVELTENSGVYVDAINLNDCKRLSKDCETLARKLLFEVFNMSALSTCSVTGARARGYDGPMQRPGLDPHARTVFLEFVRNYGTEKGWSTSKRNIFNAIRNKMQRLRITY